jgi:hypothetical protein
MFLALPARIIRGPSGSCCQGSSSLARVLCVYMYMCTLASSDGKQRNGVVVVVHKNVVSLAVAV